MAFFIITLVGFAVVPWPLSYSASVNITPQAVNGVVPCMYIGGAASGHLIHSGCV